MMKKVLILMLVLGFVSSASAAVTLDPSGSADAIRGDYSLNVVSDDTLPYEYFLAITDTIYGDITSIAIGAGAGDDAYVINYGPGAGYDSVWGVSALDESEPFDSILAGNHFTATVGFTGGPQQDLTIELLDGSLAVLDSKTYIGVPEPMTIALLGLGGLFLLRRRK